MRVCTQCGFTYGEFLARGLLGCPRCYDHLGEALWPDLLQIHPRLHRKTRPEPAQGVSVSEGVSRDLEDKARLNEMLADALRGERYEEAALLRSKLKSREDNHGSG